MREECDNFYVFTLVSFDYEILIPEHNRTQTSCENEASNERSEYGHRGRCC